MISQIIKKIFGTRNERILKGYRKVVDKINALEPEFRAMRDEDFITKTESLRARYTAGEGLDALLPEAFAAVREASQRTLGLRHFDVQMMGGMVLHDGRIAEMGTGEGKTLTATLPAYLNALSGKGVHIVTVNDYLAKRDAEWMRPVYQFLGLTVGINSPNLSPQEKQAAYRADITFGTNNEFGFDYLRDNMVFTLDQRVQRDLHYAIVDEVDSILIDEARTPLIISGQAEESSDLYTRINQLIPHLKRQLVEEKPGEEVPEHERADYTVDEKHRQVFLTEQGHEHVETLLVEAGILEEGESLYDVSHITLMHYVNACLRAHALYQVDVHYIVKDNEILIVDEHTGRLMQGRRWSEGLHQAVEAKEGVPIQLENQTLATVTFQNFFRMYEKLSGMTGTADTEAYEMQKIYGLEVVVVPTNKSRVRQDLADLIFLTARAKYKAVVKDVKERHEKGQPILLGTASIEASELLSDLLLREHIPHEVLNAKQHEREAKIIAQAGRPGMVTIATNMAGRGTDIVLGGSLEVELRALGDDVSAEAKEAVKEAWQKRHDAVITAGGLHVLGTERHESRRIDNQLRGRSGRQGDAGSSQFYLSMEDNLLRIFAADRMGNLMRRLGVTEEDVIQHPWITKAIENAQRRVENLNFDMRKNLLEYDDVANDQRKVIYQQRYELLKAEHIAETVEELRDEAITDLIHVYVPPMSMEEQWDIHNLEKQLLEDFGLALPLTQWLTEEDVHEENLHARILKEVSIAYSNKEQLVGAETLRQIEKGVMLQVLDHHWKEHLAAMDHLRHGIHLRGYAQKNPAQEFKRESFELFKHLLSKIKYDVVSTLSKMQVAHPEQPLPVPEPHLETMSFQHAEMNMFSGQVPEVTFEGDQVGEVAQNESAPFVRAEPKVGRNSLCPCGSGKKYKQCHGQLDQ